MLGSQHKRVEQSFWPVFPDYVSVSYDYAQMNAKYSKTIPLGKTIEYKTNEQGITYSN